jgi:hypothetical protein
MLHGHDHRRGLLKYNMALIEYARNIRKTNHGVHCMIKVPWLLAEPVRTRRANSMKPLLAYLCNWGHFHRTKLVNNLQTVSLHAVTMANYSILYNLCVVVSWLVVA